MWKGEQRSCFAVLLQSMYQPDANGAGKAGRRGGFDPFRIDRRHQRIDGLFPLPRLNSATSPRT